MSTDSAKLDAILARLSVLDSVEGKIDNLSTDVRRITATIETIQSSVKSNTDDITTRRAELALMRKEMDTHKQEVKLLKTSHNNREQRLRACTLRIFNLPYTIGESLDNSKPCPHASMTGSSGPPSLQLRQLGTSAPFPRSRQLSRLASVPTHRRSPPLPASHLPLHPPCHHPRQSSYAFPPQLSSGQS